MRALAVHEDLIVFVSGIWQTTCTAVRCGDEAFVIDSPVLPDELSALPGVLEQARFPVSGLLATHADWDHLLARLAFPEASLAVGESSLARLSGSIGEAQRSLRAFDEEHYIEGRGPLALAGVQSLPVPGRLSLGSVSEAEIEVHPADGHVGDGVAFWLPWLSALVCGDYLSPVEIPMITAENGGSAAAYLATLRRLGGLVEQAATVIPGHGRPLGGEDARRIHAEDLAYVERIGEAGDAPLPAGRRTARQREIHVSNLAALT